MTKEKRTKNQDSLAEAQRRHARRLKKVEKAWARLEKARRKLWRLEGELAALTSRSEDAQTRAPGQGVSPRDTHRQARLIFNPLSKSVRDGTHRLEEIVACLHSYGFVVEIGVKTSGRTARALAKAAVKQGADLVIVAGGDGTIEDIIGELVGTKTALGILPIGTMNNVARALGVPLNLEDASALLGMGTLRSIDVGRVITQSKPREVHFLETAGVGLSALAAQMGQAEEKGRWAPLLKALGKTLVFSGTNVAIACDDHAELRLDTQVVTISNAPLFGKNMLIAPDAKMDDGLLDVAIYDGMSKLDLARHLMAIANGQRIDDPHVSFQRVRHVRISASAPLQANADLHLIAEQQVWDIDVLPRALSTVVGNGMALTLPVEAAPSVPPLSGPQPPNDTSSR
jgi:diacylglycerol kinase (ATP)